MLRSRTVIAVTAMALVMGDVTVGERQFASPQHADYPESRRLDTGNEYPNVGALVTVAEKNGAGVPEGFVAKCSGTLIHERAFLTAGHCICPALPSGPPPFIRINVTLDRNARDESKWRRVVKVAGHPSLLPCVPPEFSSAWPGAPHASLHDVGLVILADPVTDVRPARLAPVGALSRATAMGADMLIVGYGHLRPVPADREFTDWDGLRRVRVRRLVQVVDDAWATWQLPGEVCGGDSGGPIFLDGQIVAVVSFGGKFCRDASIHARIDVPSVQTWIDQTIRATLLN